MSTAKQKKVCHMTSVHKQKDTRIFYKQCKSLVREGYDVTLVASGESFEEDGVKVVGVSNKYKKRLFRMLFRGRVVYKTALNLNCDIYHIHDPELLPYALKLKEKGKKVIFDSHEDYSLLIRDKDYIPKFLRHRFSKIFEQYFKHCCRRLDAIICCYHRTQEVAMKYNVHTPLIFNYPIISDEYIKTYKSGNQICFAGNIAEEWNHEKIVKALSNEKKFKYMIAGPANPYLRKILENSDVNSIMYIGQIDYNEVFLKVYNKSQVGMCLLDYIEMCQGKKGNLSNNKFFEYMMAGLPIICTDFELWKEIVEQYECGICVNPNNIHEIQNAITHICENPKIARKMGEAGRRAALKVYNWNSEEEKLFDLYKKLDSYLQDKGVL